MIFFMTILNREQKDRDLFNAIANDYAKKDLYPSTAYTRKYQLITALGNHLSMPHSTLLEIACGIGASATYLQGTYDAYYGIDYASSFIEYAHRLHHHTTRTNFITCNVKRLQSLDIPKADIILAIGALHHFTELDDVMQSIKAVAQPHTWFIALEPQRANPLVQGLRYMRGKIDAHYSDEQHYFTKKELRLLLTKHGFRNIELKYQGFLTPLFAQVIIRPSWLSLPLARFAVIIDTFIDKFMPEWMKVLSWNIIVRAQC